MVEDKDWLALKCVIELPVFGKHATDIIAAQKLHQLRPLNIIYLCYVLDMAVVPITKNRSTTLIAL